VSFTERYLMKRFKTIYLTPVPGFPIEGSHASNCNGSRGLF